MVEQIHSEPLQDFVPNMLGRPLWRERNPHELSAMSIDWLSVTAYECAAFRDPETGDDIPESELPVWVINTPMINGTNYPGCPIHEVEPCDHWVCNITYCEGFATPIYTHYVEHREGVAKQDKRIQQIKAGTWP